MPDHAADDRPAEELTGAHSPPTQAEAASSSVAPDSGRIAARLDRLPATRAIWIMVGLLSLGYFFEFYDLLFSGFIAPGLVKSGILTPTTPGLFGAKGVASFLGALFAGLFVGTIAVGWIADRFGRRSIFTWSLLAYTAANTVMAFQTTAFGLNTWRFLAGIGLGVEAVTISAYLSELAPKAIRGRAFALALAFGFCAVPTASFLAYLLIPSKPYGLDGWRWVVLIGAAAALAVWWLRAGLPESPRWLAQHGRLAEADEITRGIEARVAAESGRPLPEPGPPEPAPDQARFADMWVPPLRSRTIMLIIFNALQTVGYYGFANWLPTLLVKQGINVTSGLLYTTLIALAAPFGPLLGATVADRVERKHVIVASALAIVVLGLLFGQTKDAAAIVVLGIGLTLASNLMVYGFFTYQAELYPTGIRARAVGFVYSWSRFSAIFTGFMIAFVLGHSGVPGVFLFISAAMLMVALVIGLMGPRTRDLALEDISR